MNAELGLLDAGKAERIAAAGDRIAARRARRPVPDRRLPDRLGHLLEHERERGDRRRSPATTCTRTTTSTWASPRTTSSRRPCISPRSARSSPTCCRPSAGSSARSAAKAAEFDDVVKSGPHALDGRGAGHARPGVRRLCGAGARGHGPGRGDARAARQDPARRHRGRHRAQHPSRSSPSACGRRLAADTGLTISPPGGPVRVAGRPRRPRRGLRRAEGRRRLADEDRERPALPRLRARGPASPRSSCRSSRRARRSCPARSTRSSRRSSPRSRRR